MKVFIFVRICFLLLSFSMVIVLAQFPENGTTTSPAAQCLNARHHKPMPDTDGELHRMCSPWNEYSCCHKNITELGHNTVNHYGFNMLHCGNISEECQRYFHMDMCYFECDPYVKPWIVEVGRSIGRERILSVPLCQNQCDEWWESCKNSFTCVRNWAKHFNWTRVVRNGKEETMKTNTCPLGTKCQPFHQVYKNAKDFCEAIWDNSWLVVSNTDQCIRFNFKPPNPNRIVAEWYLQSFESSDTWSTIALVIIIIFILALCFYKFSQIF